MSEIYKQLNKRNRHRFLAWFLILVTLFNCVGPSGFALASGSERSKNWDVEYYLSTDEGTLDEIPIGENEGESIVEAERGESVYLCMNLAGSDTPDSKRFKETFTITMPTYLYYLVTEMGAKPLHLGETDATDCGYLLEEVGKDEAGLASDSVATDSEAAGNGKTRKVKLQFVEELRVHPNPQEVEIEDNNIVLSFTAMEDMKVLGQQSGNNFVVSTSIEDEDLAASILPQLDVSTDYWDAKWIIQKWDSTANDWGQDVYNKDGSIVIEDNDEVRISFAIKGLVASTDRYTDTFKLTMPRELYNLCKAAGGSIQWAKYKVDDSTSVEIFDVVSNESDSSANPVEFELSFTQELIDALPSTSLLDTSTSTIIFKADKEFVLEYKYKKDTDELELKYSEIKDPTIDVHKSIAGSFNPVSGEFERSSADPKPGTYIIFGITTNVTGGSHLVYDFPANNVFDIYDDSVYDFVSSADAKAALDIAFGGGSRNMDQKSYTDLVWALGQPTLTPYTGGAVSGLTVDPGYGVLSNEDPYTLTKEVASGKAAFTHYVCLKVEDVPADPGDYKNVARIPSKDKDDSSEPGVGLDERYYDVALRVRATSIDRHGTPINFDNNYNHDRYPEIISRDSLGVIPGDVVIYAVDVRSQGTKTAKITDVALYVPKGMKLVSVDPEMQYFSTSNDIRKPSSTSTQFAQAGAAAFTYLGTQKFKEHPFYQDVTPVDYAEYYEVEVYNYELPNAGAQATFYYACKVLDLEDVFGANADMTLAADYGYMMTAEVSGFCDANTGAKSGVDASVIDADSVTDTDAFNDWYYWTTENHDDNDPNASWALKKQNLYKSAGASGELDNEMEKNVRALPFYPDAFKPFNRTDEDDFDFALVVPIKTTNTKENFVSKEITKVNDINHILQTIDAADGTKYSDPTEYTVLSNTATEITGTKTIIPYFVRINHYGAEDMKNVVMTDQLPTTMKFLTYGGEPVVRIYEKVATDGQRYPGLNANGDPVNIISSTYNRYQLQEVKKPLDPLYYANYPSTKPGEETHPPTTLKPGNIWDVSLDNASNQLTVDFGDIGFNSYIVLYFGIVETYSDSYRNDAIISWDGDPYPVSHRIDMRKDYWSSSASGKAVSLNANGPFDSADKLKAAENVTLYYQLHVNLSMNNNMSLPKGDFKMTDKIVDPMNGTVADNVEYEFIKITEYGGAPVQNSLLSVDYNSAAQEVAITNPDHAIDTSINYLIYFKVTYKQVPYGKSIKNSFSSSTTEVTTPMKLDLLKVKADKVSGLDDAKFKLTYDAAGNVAVKGFDTLPVTFTTAGGGKDSATFYYIEDNAYKNNDGTYSLFLTETDPPDGYYKLGGKDGDPSSPYVIELKVSKRADGTYTVIPVDQDKDFWEIKTSEDSLNVIQMKAVNYPKSPEPETTKASFAAKKTLENAPTGVTLEDDDFTFTAELVYVPTGKAVKKADNSPFAEGGTITAENKANGTVPFETLTYDLDGEYIFKITENGVLNTNIDYDDADYYVSVHINAGGTVTITYYEDYDKLLNVLSNPITGTVPEFINKYKEEPVVTLATASVAARKELKNAQITDGQFNFEAQVVKVTGGNVEKQDGTVLSVGEKLDAANAGNDVVFEVLTFSADGVYIFKITEKDERLANITYDQSDYYAVIKVTNNVAEVNYYEDYDAANGVSGNPSKEIAFVNTYKETPPGPKPTYKPFTLQAGKTLRGGDLSAGDFTFKAELWDTDTQVTMEVLSAENDGSGLVKFPSVTLEEAGYYVFKISEVAGSDNGIHYDGTIYYAAVTVTMDAATKVHSVDVSYGNTYDAISHEVEGDVTRPEFINTAKGYITIQKVSYSGNRPLTGAEFQISYKLKNATAWTVLKSGMKTEGTNGSIHLEMPKEYWMYDYQLIETKAPSGYSNSRVGTITFGMAEDGTIINLESNGSSGYVALSSDKSTIIAKNHTTGGGGGGGGNPPDPTRPTNPTTPTTQTSPTTPTDPTYPTIPTEEIPENPIPYNPGDPVPPGKMVVTIIGDDGVPKAYLIDDPNIPMGGLARTGDAAASAMMLAMVMLAGMAGFGGMVLQKRRNEK